MYQAILQGHGLHTAQLINVFARHGEGGVIMLFDRGRNHVFIKRTCLGRRSAGRGNSGGTRAGEKTACGLRVLFSVGTSLDVIVSLQAANKLSVC